MSQRRCHTVYHGRACLSAFAKNGAWLSSELPLAADHRTIAVQIPCRMAASQLVNVYKYAC